MLWFAALFAACRRSPRRRAFRTSASGWHPLRRGRPGRVLELRELSRATERGERTLARAAVCDTCHSGRPPKVRVPSRRRAPDGEIRIDHDKHLAMPEIRGQCVPCHAGVVDAKRPPLPPMSQCFSCHEHEEQWAQAQCTPCHEPEALRRTMPTTFLKHDTGFLRHHGTCMAERQQAQLCQSCHTQAQCQACHDVTQDLTVEKRRPEKIESGQVHRGDFMVRHAIEARSQPARCLSCHTVQTCDSCHAARGVSANVANPANPHPPEWVGTNTSSSNFHGTAARRDIVACAGCHEAGPPPIASAATRSAATVEIRTPGLEERARSRFGNVQVLPWLTGETFRSARRWSSPRSVAALVPSGCLKTRDIHGSRCGSLHDLPRRCQSPGRLSVTDRRPRSISCRRPSPATRVSVHIRFI